MRTGTGNSAKRSTKRKENPVRTAGSTPSSGIGNCTTLTEEDWVVVAGMTHALLGCVRNAIGNMTKGQRGV